MNTLLKSQSTVSERDRIIAALYAWIKQRPSLEYGNYGNPTSYRAELRSITQDLHDAKTLLRAVELSNISGKELKAAFSAFSGRLQWKAISMNRCGEPCADCGTKNNREHFEHCKGGEHTLEGHRLDYCTGQYWPTEYRKAVCAVAASALWHYLRDAFVKDANDGESPGDAIRRNFRERYGKRMQTRWFD